VRTVARILVVLLVLGALGIAGYKGYERYRKVQGAKAKRDPSAPVLRVACARVRAGDITQTDVLTGTVQPMAEVNVGSKVAGRLEYLRLEDGTPVDKGLVIKKPGVRVAVIDHKQLAAEVKQAQAALAVAKAAVAEAVVVLKDADREEKRITDLWKEGSATGQQRDKVITAGARARAAHLLAKAKVLQAEAALERMQTVYEEAFIKAPIAGVVAHKYLDEGNMIDPATPIIKIVDIDTVKVVVGVNEAHACLLQEGVTKATIEIDSDGKVPFEGTVAAVGVVSDPVTHTVEVELHVPNPKHQLRPGAFARVRLVLKERHGVPLIPDIAVMGGGEAGTTSVFVVSDGKAHRRAVELGESQGPLVEVRKGLRLGEQVVVRGQQMLSEGASVEVVDVEEVNAP